MHDRPAGRLPRELSPFDELRLVDMQCRAHEEDMKRVTDADPVDGMLDPIDGVSREFPRDVEEPLPDLF